MVNGLMIIVILITKQKKILMELSMPYILPVCILLFIFFPLSTVRSYPSISRYCRNGNGANSCFDFVILALDLTFSDVLQDCKAWTYDFKANARNIKQFFTVGINSNDSEPQFDNLWEDAWMASHSVFSSVVRQKSTVPMDEPPACMSS